MVGFIWFVIILFIVLRSINNAKKSSGQAKPNVPRSQAKNRRQTAASQTGKWSEPQAQRSHTQSSRQKTRTENSILQKAKENASRQFDTDTLEKRGAAELNRVPLGDEIVKDQAKARHIHSEHETDHSAELRNQHGVDDFDTYHLMDEVNDLIVKGYSGNLEFERDFVAEATDMLNRMYG